MTDDIFPAPEIRTERLLLTRLESDDAVPFHRYRSDPEVGRYQTWKTVTLEEARQFIRNQQRIAFDTPDTWFQFAIRTRGSVGLIGDLGVRFPQADTRQVEIGITVAPGHQRRGYGVEGVRGILDFLLGERNKHRVFASVDPRNMASIALLRRVGMRQEAHFRQSLWNKDAWEDDLIFAILGSEWIRGERDVRDQDAG